jgi:glycosyltransferase involved in cell wall biosynthesis
MAYCARAGAYDLIEQGVNGLIVPQKDVFALYQALKTILLDPSLASKGGSQSLKYIDRF